MNIADYIVLVVLGVLFLLIVFGAGVAVGYEVNKFINEKINNKKIL